MAATHKVVSGDTLSKIAADNYTKYGGSTYNTRSKYQNYLVKLNNIEDPDKIYVGEVIKLTSTGGTTPKTTKRTSTKKAVVNRFGLQSNTNNTLFATWKWDVSNTEKYQTRWYYSTGDGVWFIGSDSDSTTANLKQTTYSYPDNAQQVRFYVRPVSKTKTTKDAKGKEKKTSYWTADWSDVKTYVVKEKPEKPNAPSTFEIDQYKLSFEMDGLESLNATGIQFQIVKNNSSVYKTGKLTIKTGHVEYSCTIATGGEYKVRCRSYKGDAYSEWSEYTGNETTAPSAVKAITQLYAQTPTSVGVNWDPVSTATGYTIEYTTNKGYFDKGGGDVSSTTSTEDAAVLSNLTSGKTYYVRIKATNEAGESNWCPIRSVIVGTVPAAPTTWSSTSTAITDEPFKLYWTHNSEDESEQQDVVLHVQLLDASGVIIYNNTDVSDVAKDAKEYTITASWMSTHVAKGATQFKWRVKTRGALATRYYKVTKSGSTYKATNTPVEIFSGSAVSGVTVNGKQVYQGTDMNNKSVYYYSGDAFSDWSIVRIIELHAKPTLDLRVTSKDDRNATEISKLHAFPFYIRAIPGPNTQTPISYHVTISNGGAYETTDELGNVKMVNAKEILYSKHISATSTQTGICWDMISAEDVDLKNNRWYTIKCVVNMASGLTAEASQDIQVLWNEIDYSPNAEIFIDDEVLTAQIRPYCMGYNPKYYRAWRDAQVNEYGEYEFTATNEELDIAYGTRSENSYTTKCYPSDLGREGYQVYVGEAEDGTDFYYYIVEEETSSLANVTLSIYRREFDGSFTEIATGLTNSRATYVTDPHPALDYARYRIVAIEKKTGAVGYTDLPGYPVGETAIIIQWDEDWSNFDVDANDNAAVDPNWSGSMLRLPYNIDVSDTVKPDVEMINYIGREHPVSYYGTHIGFTSTWNTEIPKDDEETLYTLRRLQRWMGDVYVREPSGSGYWANITVSFSQKHLGKTIPVSFSITRVEGGA